MMRNATAVGRIADPPGDAFRDPQPVKPGGNDLTREEVVLHEAAEAPADAILATRDDRGVRDRNAHRVAEQRGDREPVREPTHHRRLGRGAYEPEPGVLPLEHRGDDEYHR